MSVPHIITTKLSTANKGKSYTQNLAAVGGSLPYTWSATNLPVGLSIKNGSIVGVPTKAQTNKVTITVKDMAKQTATQTFTLVVTDALQFSTPASLPGAVNGQAYTEQFTVTGGVAPDTYSVQAGSTLPAGLTLSPSGVLSGTPTKSGTFTFTLAVSDSE